MPAMWRFRFLPMFRAHERFNRLTDDRFNRRHQGMGFRHDVRQHRVIRRTRGMAVAFEHRCDTFIEKNDAVKMRQAIGNRDDLFLPRPGGGNRRRASQHALPPPPSYPHSYA